MNYDDLDHNNNDYWFDIQRYRFIQNLKRLGFTFYTLNDPIENQAPIRHPLRPISKHQAGLIANSVESYINKEMK